MLIKFLYAFHCTFYYTTIRFRLEKKAITFYIHMYM